MSLEFNIGLSIAKAARRHEGKLAFVGAAQKMTYTQFENLLAATTMEFKERGVGRDSVVGIHTIDSRLAVAGIAAANLLGAPWVHATPSALRKPSLKVSHVLCVKNAKQKPDHPNLMEFESGWLDKRSLDYWFEQVDPQGFASPEQPARIGQSSGTTGAHKFIAISEIDNFKRSTWQPVFMKEETTVLGCLFPPLSGVGLNSRVRTLIDGGCIVETGILEQQAGWISAGVNTIIASPSQFATLLSEMTDDPARRFAKALVGGGRPSAQFLEKMAERFDKICVFYGSTEMGHAAETVVTDVASFDGALDPLTEDGIEIQVVDENDVSQPAGVEGVVRLRREGFVPHYIQDPLANSDAIRDGWFYPGDLGVFAESGRLQISGRVNDSLNIGGVKINALTVDDFIQSDPNISDGYCFVIPDETGIDRVNILASFKPGLPDQQAATMLLERISAKVAKSLRPRAVYVVSAVPRTDTGKPVRRKAAEIAGTIAPLATA